MTDAGRGPAADMRIVASLVLLAIAVRLVRWALSEVIFADGPRFIAIAKRASAGDWDAVLADDYHPLYPILIAAVEPLVGSFEWAGALVSIASGALSVVFLVRFVQASFGERPGWIAGFLLAVHPRAIDFTSDVQSEGLYLAMFLGALWFGWRALESHRVREAAACGAMAGIAYLVRPEGLGAVGVVGVLGVVGALRGRIPPARLLACAGAMALGSALVIAPYVAAMSESAGTLTLTRKKSISVMLGMKTPADLAAPAAPPPSASLPALRGPDASAPAPPSAAAALSSLARKASKALRYEVLLLLGIGLWSVRWRIGKRGAFFAVLVGAYGTLLFALFMDAGYVSRRHWLPVLAPLLGYAALGVPILGRMILRALRRPSHAESRVLAAGLSIVVLALAIELPQVRGRRHQAERMAGEIVAASGATGTVIATQRRYASYYAGGRHLPIDPSPETLDHGRLRERGATHVILRAETFEPEEWDALLEQPGLSLLRRVEARGRAFLVIEVAAESR